jgi:hypothetical protein
MTQSIGRSLAVRATSMAVVVLSAAAPSVAAQSRDRIAYETIRVPASIVERINRQRVSSSIQCKCAGFGPIVARDPSRPSHRLTVQLRPAALRLRTESALVIVDGIILSPFEAATLDISRMDIRSVEILDATEAAAPYGPRGSGRVILVLTNRGKE